jgi:uncharacterized protein (DUF952 family)
MTALDTQPRYLYKIIASNAPIREPIPERLPVSELDRDSGFIHLSMAHQVPSTLNLFFMDEPVVYILRIEYGRVIQDIRWESPDGKVSGPRPAKGLFPVSYTVAPSPAKMRFLLTKPKHMYNDLKLGKEEVESLAIWQNEDGWDKALSGAEPWLLY